MKMGIFKILIVSCLLNSIVIGQSYFIIDTTKIITKDVSHQCYPQVVFDGDNFIATWLDGRKNRGSSANNAWYYVVNSIYATRISTQGTVLDTIGICIDEEEPDSIYYEVSCATSGNNCLIAGMYMEQVTPVHIKALRIAGDLSILDSTPLVETDVYYPKVTFGGGYYLLVFVYDDLCGQRITEEGVVVDSHPISLVPPSPHASFNFQLTSDGDNYLLVYPDSIALWGIMINNQLQVIDTISIIRWNGVEQVPAFDVTFGGGNYLVSFANYQYIYGVRIRPDGIVIDTVPILIDTLPNASYSRCAYGDSIYLVVIEFQGNLYCKRISIDGQILDPNLIPINDDPSARYPSVAFGGGNFIVVWQDYLLGDIDIRYTIITPEGQVVNPDGIILSTATQTQEDPAIAFDGTNYLAVWQDYRDYCTTKTDIYGALLNQEGGILDPGIFVICHYDNSQSQPRVCFGGSNYFVVWVDERAGSGLQDIYGTRITPEGTVLDSLGIPIHTAWYDDVSPAVAFDGVNYLVVSEVECPDTRIYGARVSINGILLDTVPFIISDTLAGLQIDQDYPEVVFNGENYLVAWQRSHSGYEEIWGAIVEPTGLVHDNFRISEDYNLPSRPPSITSNGDDFYVAWYDSPRTFGVRVSSEGSVLDTPSVYLGRGTSTSLAFDGMNYLLIRRSRNPYNKLNVCLINQQGEPLDTNGLDILQTPSPLRISRVTKGPFIQCLAVFGTYAPEPYNTQRIHGKLFNTSDIIEVARLLVEPVSFSISPSIVKKLLTLQLSLTKEEVVRIKIYDISGRKIENLLNNLGKLAIGSHQFKIDLSNLSNGVYFLKIDPSKIIKKFIVTN
jgi:hypothetical protein